MKFHSLIDAVVATVAWFDRIDYPVTHAEVARFCWRHGTGHKSLAEIDQALKTAVSQGQLELDSGYFCLPGRQGIWEARMKRTIMMERKALKVKRYAKWLRHVPGLRLLAICNDGGIFAAGPNSDIDLFIIARTGTLWWVRFWAIIFVTLSGQQRNAADAEDPLCLSFYTTDSELNLSNLAHAGTDPYLAYWLQALYPIINDGIFTTLVETNRAWVENYVESWSVVMTHPRWLISPGVSANWVVSAGINNLFGRLQKSKLSAELPRHNWPGAGVIVSENLLKFHRDDARIKIRDHWLQTLKSLNLDYELE